MFLSLTFVLIPLTYTSRSGWPLQNIHISNYNVSITFFADVFFPLSLRRLLSDLTVYMSNCLTRNCLPFMSTWVHTRILVRSVLPIVLVFFVVCFALFVFVLCLVYPMLSVSLDCQFLITLSVFSNVVMHTIRSFPHSWLITRFSRRVARCVPHLEQEPLTLPEHMSSLVGLAKFASLYL
jgi:hypothetical protein